MATVLQSFKMNGQTTGAVSIATVSFDFMSDGTIRYLDSNSKTRTFPLKGDLSRFFKEALTGASGLTNAVLE